MQYTIERVRLADDHPLWSGQTVYKLLNLYNGRYSLGCYTTLEAANWALSRRQKNI